MVLMIIEINDKVLQQLATRCHRYINGRSLTNGRGLHATSKSLKFFSKLKRNINRGWYWFIGVAFLGTTVAVMFVTYRMVSIWLRDYGG